MASIDFIIKRINGKEKEIEKLNKKLERIQKAKKSNWKNNPYYYDEYELERTNRELNHSKNQLQKLNLELQIVKEKENSRNVLAITQFLDEWLKRNILFYTEEKKRYDNELLTQRKNESKYIEWYNSQRYSTPIEERKEIEKNYKENRTNFIQNWRHVTQFEHGSKSWKDTMLYDLKSEYNRKYDYIIERTNEIVGIITDASCLRIDEKGNLNGYIIGTKGKASVNTIGAGGYNIQCYHFRTLINEII